MSECKHEWCLKSGRGYLYCPLCGKTVPVENYVESLEAKLAAAERHKQLFCDEMNVYKKGCAVVEKQRDELQVKLAAIEKQMANLADSQGQELLRRIRMEKQHALLVGVLKKAESYIVTCEQFGGKQYDELMENINKAISTTAEATEKGAEPC